MPLQWETTKKEHLKMVQLDLMTALEVTTRALWKAPPKVPLKPKKELEDCL